MQSVHEEKSFLRDLEQLINSYSRENNSNTPDFLLAEFIGGCLDVYEHTTKERDRWYSVVLCPGKSHFIEDTPMAGGVPPQICEAQTSP